MGHRQSESGAAPALPSRSGLGFAGVLFRLERAAPPYSHRPTLDNNQCVGVREQPAPLPGHHAPPPMRVSAAGHWRAGLEPLAVRSPPCHVCENVSTLARVVYSARAREQASDWNGKMNGKKSSLLLDASGLPASSHPVVRSLKTYKLADLEVSTDAGGARELLQATRDGFAATIVAASIELAEKQKTIHALDLQVGQLDSRLNEAHVRIDLFASDLRRALLMITELRKDQNATACKVNSNRLGVDVAQRAIEALMVNAGALK